MKVLVIGAAGTIGKAVVKELSSRHEVIAAGRNSGDNTVDITDINSISDLYQKIGKVDSVICVAGVGYLAPLAEVTPGNFKEGFNDKLLGQINLVLLGQSVIADKGSFTLVSGILAEDPILGGANISTINAAIEGFARAAAIELPRGIRINVVSPSVVTESLAAYGEFFRGFESVSAARVALAFSKSVEGVQTGQVYRVR